MWYIAIAALLISIGLLIWVIARSYKPVKVMVSGHFDPLHIGHVQHIRAAKLLGNQLIVVLSTDEQCIAKKGYCFMPFKERKGILEALRGVDKVVLNIDKDNTSAESIRLYHPDIFAKGGDRNLASLPKSEVKICQELGIKIVFGTGGKKVQSSSELVVKGGKNV